MERKYFDCKIRKKRKGGGKTKRNRKIKTASKGEGRIFSFTKEGRKEEEKEKRNSKTKTASNGEGRIFRTAKERKAEEGKKES
jgi:hypothetical protein